MSVGKWEIVKFGSGWHVRYSRGNGWWDVWSFPSGAEAIAAFAAGGR